MAQYGSISSSTSSKAANKSVATVEESDSLLSYQRHDVDDSDEPDDGIAARHLVAFYAGHALFMWNNRCYEFAAVLFTASAFPHTLTAASLRALCAHLASVLLSPSIGRWFNRHPSRLRPVQGCILAQRLCIAIACLGWVPIMLEGEKDRGARWSDMLPWVFALLIMLGMVERLSAVGNLAVVERDWLPLLSTKRRTPNSQERAEESTIQSEPSSNLHLLNATTKRIDLVTKLVAPLAVSRVVISTDSVKAAATILALLQPISCVMEMYVTQLVWRNCASLQARKSYTEEHSNQSNPCPENEDDSSGRADKSRAKAWLNSIARLSPAESLRRWFASFNSYLKHPVSLPSLAYALEPFSVLTLAGSMTAYLLAASFSLNDITIARTASTIVEISSTILTPLMISWVSKRSRHNTTDSIRPLVIVGVIGLLWQLLCLLPVTVMFATFPALNGLTPSTSMSLSTLLFTGLALSRLGPFAYSLVEQQLVQIKVEPSERIIFSSIETALFDVAELARWGMLMVFPRTSDFRWAALLSFGSVVLSMAMVLAWAKKNRTDVV